MAIIHVKDTDDGISLYPHQIAAIERLNELDANGDFSGILSLPTGGGKTMTATYWLTQNALRHHCKILWLAHRTMLLEQAYDAFCRCAVKNLLPNISIFSMRIVSGEYDSPASISPSDDVLIVMRNSLQDACSILGRWLWEYSGPIYFIIDECHHSAAKTYQQIYKYLRLEKNRIPSRFLKILGLTATPSRTNKNEISLLREIFNDNIIYKVDLRELINARILARPVLQEVHTNISFGQALTPALIQEITQQENVPDCLAIEIASNTARNQLIVQTYYDNKEIYGKTIVFVPHQIQAVALCQQFARKGVLAEVVISDGVNHRIDLQDPDNAAKIERFRNGSVQVLINVQILTEGSDLPLTHSVFLARPTVSEILMTQMIGRALRGLSAGGTKDAYIVSFVDDWQGKIQWLTPQQLEDFADMDIESIYPQNFLPKGTQTVISENAIQDVTDRSLSYFPPASYTIHNIKTPTVPADMTEQNRAFYSDLIRYFPRLRYENSSMDSLISDDGLVSIEVDPEDGDVRVFEFDGKNWIQKPTELLYDFLTNHFSDISHTKRPTLPQDPKKPTISSPASKPSCRDSVLTSALKLCLETPTISVSFLQRRLRLGYPRAGRVMDQLEELGVVGVSNGSKPREVHHDVLESIFESFSE